MRPTNKHPLTAISLIFAVCAVLLTACPVPEELETGTITGNAFYKDSDNHSGITVSLEKTDGILSVSASSAARNVAAGAQSIGYARSITASRQTSSDGSYSFTDVMPGIYTIYASSSSSSEKAVMINHVVVTPGRSVTAASLTLTPVGKITGRIKLDDSETGNHGFFVCVAGTSFMAVTKDNGEFEISDVPVNNGYTILVIKGNYTTVWSNSVNVTAGGISNLSPANVIYNADIIAGNFGLQWKGELASHPANAKLNWAYFNTTDSITYIHNGTSFVRMIVPGTSGGKAEITIGPNGNWFIDDVDSGVKAQGPEGPIGPTGPEGPQGHSPVITIGVDGYWYIDGNKTNVSAKPPTGDPDDPVITGDIIFDLKETLDGKPFGMINNEVEYEAVFDNNKISYVGAIGMVVDYEIVEDGFKVTASGQSWTGLDLSNHGLQFRVGDMILIEGYTVTATNLVLNLNNNGWDPLHGWNPNMPAGTEFRKLFTLTAGDVTKILNNPYVPGIRIRAADAGSSWVLTQIIVAGNRDDIGVQCYCDTDCECDCADDCLIQCPGCEPEAFATNLTVPYIVPQAAADNEFYLNLNNFTSNTMTGSGPDAAQGITSVVTSANNIKFLLDRNDQRINFTLTQEQLDLIADALLLGEGINVVIDGTAGPYNVRYGIANPDQMTNWNATTVTPASLLSTILNSTLSPTGNINYGNMYNFNSFMIQSRQAVKNLVEIKSIKIVLPVTQVVNINSIPIIPPVPGEFAQTTTTATTQYGSGSISWSPTPVDGIFDSNTAYTANVILTPRNKYWTFFGHGGQFTSGVVNGTITSWASQQAPIISFTFPATVIAGDFPVDAEIKAQMMSSDTPPALIDIPAEGVITGTELNVTYNPGTGGPITNTVTFQWQRFEGGNWVTKGTGVKFTPANTDVGTWRIRITANGFLPKVSDTFTALSPIMAGDFDTALNANFSSEGTSVFSLANWIAINPTAVNYTPIVWNGVVQREIVAGGINVINRTNEWDCAILVIGSLHWGHSGLDLDLSANNYKITYYGFYISDPASWDRAVIQKEGDGWQELATQSWLNSDNSFMVEYYTDGEIFTTPAANDNLRIGTTGTSSYRITLLEVEDLGPRN